MRKVVEKWPHPKRLRPSLSLRTLSRLASLILWSSMRATRRVKKRVRLDLKLKENLLMKLTENHLKLKEKSTEADERKQLAIQQAALEIKKKFGKNAILKGMNLEQGGTAIERNGQIGGHRG